MKKEEEKEEECSQRGLREEAREKKEQKDRLKYSKKSFVRNQSRIRFQREKMKEQDSNL